MSLCSWMKLRTQQLTCETESCGWFYKVPIQENQENEELFGQCFAANIYLKDTQCKYLSMSFCVFPVCFLIGNTIGLKTTLNLMKWLINLFTHGFDLNYLNSCSKCRRTQRKLVTVAFECSSGEEARSSCTIKLEQWN